MPDIIQIAMTRKKRLTAELEELERFIEFGESLAKDSGKSEPLALGDAVRPAAAPEPEKDNVNRITA